MTRKDLGKDRMQSFSLMPGMLLHIADFKPLETIEQKFETANPVLRFYFYRSVCGYWELHSPYRTGSQNKIAYTHQLSSVFFYPELEGKIYLPAECRQFHLSIYITQDLLNNYLGDYFAHLPKTLREISEGCMDKGFYHGKLNIGFRKMYGTTVFGYLRRMRLLEAKRLIDQGDMNVTEVALSVGYNSLPSFSKAFTEFYGIPPMQCLKKRFRSFGTRAMRN